MELTSATAVRDVHLHHVCDGGVESSEGAPENGVRHWEQCATLWPPRSSGFYFRRLATCLSSTIRTFVTLPAGTKPDPILDMFVRETSSSLFVFPYLIPHVYGHSCGMDNLEPRPTKSPANLVCNRQNKSARNANASSTTRHDLRFVGSIAMGSRDDNVGPASPVRCIGGKTVACFPQLRSPDRGVREPLIPSGRATPAW